MDGVQDLRARIEALSSKITLQRELLKNLEREKSLTQRQLNAVFDPVARLPTEISSEIFLQTLPPTPEKPAAPASPMLLLNICNAWTDIALSIPRLWASICVVYPCAASFEEGFRTWLHRAGSRPISISLRGRFREDGTASIIWNHAERFKHLEICDEQEVDINVDLRGGMETIDLLGVKSPGRLPLLETLTIRGSGLVQEEFCGRQILQLLRSAPSLIECTFEDVHPVSEYKIEENAPTLVLPGLRRMMFGELPDCPRSGDCILKYLTLPALQNLRLSLRDMSGDDLLSLLRRSAPPLEELALGDGFRAGSIRLHECLELVPILERFEMWGMNINLLGELLTTLTSSPSIVPNFHTLKISNLYKSGNAPDSCWEALLRVLSSRSKMRIVHVELSPYSNIKNPTADILAAFKDLAQHGLQIYIGSDGRTNLVMNSAVTQYPVSPSHVIALSLRCRTPCLLDPEFNPAHSYRCRHGCRCQVLVVEIFAANGRHAMPWWK
ncbi:hypothetical protein C8R47DRAFT_1153548 [Mycena vitilis]|nr:hypothetical protein C8R47DRAFT_1153548 [Mycena vitilis]